MSDYRIKISPKDLNVNIPINLDFSTHGKEDLIVKYEDKIVDEVINPVTDFEITRFSHDEWLGGNKAEYSTHYEFSFYDRSKAIEDTNLLDLFRYQVDYNFSDIEEYSGETFTNKEIYYYSNSFKNSFFKLDLYDTDQSETQKLYLSLILPVQQGNTTEVDIGNIYVPNVVNIKKPSFILDHIGDKEGYYIYWLKNRDYLDISTFYMSAKFFNAKTGEFIRMTNLPQCMISKKFEFEKSKYHYHRVELDYDNFTYKIYNPSNERRGTIANPIKWYEYINP